nr:MAG TPA: Rep protein [Bacteriophage sp.]
MNEKQVYRSKSLKVETIDVTKYYSITVSPSDHHQYFESKERLKMFFNWAQITFYRLLLNTEYEMHIEVSPMGRLHLHGKIKLLNKERLLKFYLYDIPRINNISVFEIDTISDMVKWDTYCTKQKTLQLGYISHKDKLNKLALIDIESEVIYKKIEMKPDKSLVSRKRV